MSDTSAESSDYQIQHDRFYLCDIGESSAAFLVCGSCLSENERDFSLYDELDPLDESVIDDGNTRVCMICDADSREVRSIPRRDHADV